VFVEIARDDAKRLKIDEGDQVEVTSRRGTLRGPARIGDILPGHIFIPFHYGYWDKDNGRHRAANELTIGGWDPVSKQPHYKYAAVQLRKAGVLTGMGAKTIDVASKAVTRVKETTDLLLSGAHAAPRSHFPDAMGQLRASLTQFAEACRSLKKVHFQELELVGCWETFAQWCDELNKRLEPFAGKYGEKAIKEPAKLRRTLFSATRTGEFGELRDLQSLEVLASALHGANTLLIQSSQGLRDPDLLDAALDADEHIRRIQAWIANQVKHRAVHSLLVPM